MTLPSMEVGVQDKEQCILLSDNSIDEEPGRPGRGRELMLF